MTNATLSPVAKFIEIVRSHVAQGQTLTSAAARAKAQHPELAADVLDRLGAWPSSEPELRELQRIA